MLICKHLLSHPSDAPLCSLFYLGHFPNPPTSPRPIALLPLFSPLHQASLAHPAQICASYSKILSLSRFLTNLILIKILYPYTYLEESTPVELTWTKMWATHLKNSVLKLSGSLYILKICWEPQSFHAYSYIYLYVLCLKLKLQYQFTFFFLLFRATPSVYGNSQARGRIRAAATSLRHSHSNTRFLIHWLRPGIKPTSSWILVRLVTHQALTGTPRFTLK